jgi:hydroxymethylpyrimidine pyrophosphatase-like HAD family hydrolase
MEENDMEFSDKIAVIIINKRYFKQIGRKGQICTAWSAGGGKHYYPYSGSMLDDLKKISKKGKKPQVELYVKESEKDSIKLKVLRQAKENNEVWLREKIKERSDAIDSIYSIAVDGLMDDADKVSAIRRIAHSYTGIPF